MATYSTFSDAETALLANADFEEVGSVSKAKAFVSAANAWMILCPDSSANQSSSLTIGKAYVENLLNRARSFITANDTASAAKSRVRFLGADIGFRG